MFELSVEQARATVGSKLREHYPLVFNNYLKWYLASTHVELCKLTYGEEILEGPTIFDDISQHKYNKYVKEGTRVPYAPVMNFLVKCSPLHFTIGHITSLLD